MQAKLIAVDHVTLSPIFLNKEKLNVVPGTDQNTTVAHLNKNFGSKKIKRHTEQLERMKIDVDIVKEQLEETVQSKCLIF